MRLRHYSLLRGANSYCKQDLYEMANYFDFTNGNCTVRVFGQSLNVQMSQIKQHWFNSFFFQHCYWFLCTQSNSATFLYDLLIFFRSIQNMKQYLVSLLFVRKNIFSTTIEQQFHFIVCIIQKSGGYSFVKLWYKMKLLTVSQ